MLIGIYINFNNLPENNLNGLRVEKYCNGVYNRYTYNGDLLVCESNGTDTIWYTYNESGSPVGIELNGTQYYYIKNVQDDIIGIVDTSGNKVVEYTYNAWGYLRSISGSLASTLGVKNHLRYRGYYYDVETKLYYLQSRYYDPQTGRFINSDDTDYIGADGSNCVYSISGSNSWSKYC